MQVRRQWQFCREAKRRVQHQPPQTRMGIALGFQAGVEVVEAVGFPHGGGQAVFQSLTYAAHLLAVAAAAAALILLAKKQDSLAFKLAALGAALGAVSVIASLIYGDIDTLAFAAAVLAALGVGLSISISAEE